MHGCQPQKSRPSPRWDILPNYIAKVKQYELSSERTYYVSIRTYYVAGPKILRTSEALHSGVVNPSLRCIRSLKVTVRDNINARNMYTLNLYRGLAQNGDTLNLISPKSSNPTELFCQLKNKQTNTPLTIALLTALLKCPWHICLGSVLANFFTTFLTVIMTVKCPCIVRVTVSLKSVHW